MSDTEITDEMVEAARRVLLNIAIPAETSVRNALTAALKVDREARARSYVRSSEMTPETRLRLATIRQHIAYLLDRIKELEARVP